MNLSKQEHYSGVVLNNERHSNLWIILLLKLLTKIRSNSSSMRSLFISFYKGAFYLLLIIDKRLTSFIEADFRLAVHLFFSNWSLSNLAPSLISLAAAFAYPFTCSKQLFYHHSQINIPMYLSWNLLYYFSYQIQM